MTSHPLLDLLSRLSLIGMALSYLITRHLKGTDSPLALALTWAAVACLVAYAVAYDALEYDDGGWSTISWAVHLAQRSCVAVVPSLGVAILWWFTHWTVVKSPSGVVDWPALLKWSAFYAAEAFVMGIAGGTWFGQVGDGEG